MYENVHTAMVEAGIAEELEEEIHHEKDLPTKFALTKPEFHLFQTILESVQNQLEQPLTSTLLSCSLSLAQANRCFMLLSSKANKR
jgi:hypothetical protein